MNLHKRYDFSFTGGFPLTQEVLGRMQDATSDAIEALIAMGGSVTGPMKISGMDITETAPGTFVVTDGWFIYNNKLVKFTGDTVTPTGGQVLLVELTETATSMTYFDASTHDAQLETVSIVIAAATVTDATHFPLSALNPFGRSSSWVTETFTDEGIGEIDGTVSYKKNTLANTLLLKGDLTPDHASMYAEPDTADYITLTTLAAEYRPATDQYFAASVTNVGIVYPFEGINIPMKSLNMRLKTNGDLQVLWLQYLGTGGGLDFGTYNMQFTETLFLD